MVRSRLSMEFLEARDVPASFTLLDSSVDGSQADNEIRAVIDAGAVFKLQDVNVDSSTPTGDSGGDFLIGGPSVRV